MREIFGRNPQLNQRHQLVIGVLFAFWLRAYRLGFQELRGDEAFSYVAARGSLADLFDLLINIGEPHPPLHFLLMHASIRTIGDSEFALRFVGVAVSILAVPAAYWIGRHLFKRHDWALGLLILVAINPLQIWAAQDARHQYALVAAWSTVATAAFLFAVTRQQRRWWTLYALFALLTMYSHYYGIFPLAAHGVYLLVDRNWRAIRGWLLAGIGAAALFVPWLILHAAGLARRVDEASNPRLLDHISGVWRELTVASTTSLSTSVLAIALILVTLGTIELWRKQPAWMVALWFWVLSTTVALYVVRLGRALFNDFYIMPASLPWLILMLAGVWFLNRQVRVAGVMVAGLAIALVTGISLSNYYFSAEFSKSWGYRDAAAHLSAEATANDALIAHSPDPNFDYYFRNTPAFRTLSPPRAGMTPEEVGASLNALAMQYERLWFVPAHKSSWDPANVAFEWLDFETIRVFERDYKRLTLLGYQPTSNLNGVAHSINRQLRDELVLQSVVMTAAGELVDPSQSIEMVAGERLRVNLQWQALRQLDTSYTVFVHLLGSNGQMLAQHDGIPVRAARPTNYWQADDVYWDLHELFLPDTISAESGTLYIGLYTSDTVERQSFDDGIDTWPLTTITFRSP